MYMKYNVMSRKATYIVKMHILFQEEDGTLQIYNQSPYATLTTHYASTTDLDPTTKRFHKSFMFLKKQFFSCSFVLRLNDKLVMNWKSQIEVILWSCINFLLSFCMHKN